MTLIELQKRAVDEITKAFARAENHYGRKFHYKSIEFCNRLSVTAGEAYLDDQKIVLSNKVMQLNPEDFIGRTPAHEAAHLIAYQIHTRRGNGHGPLWREVMLVIGQEPSRCHSMTTPGEQKYKSECGTIKHLTKIRHNKLQRGKVAYYKWKDGVKVRKEDWVRT